MLARIMKPRLALLPITSIAALCDGLHAMTGHITDIYGEANSGFGDHRPGQRRYRGKPTIMYYETSHTAARTSIGMLDIPYTVEYRPSCPQRTARCTPHGRATRSEVHPGSVFLSLIDGHRCSQDSRGQ
ncbi:hypothetical protein PYCCODRAFT_1211525 [Trametes coccinea BRFM310]|uniref:Uncharacterized protein n=1 Tax=Trametes coccinea (strain BRFM310) TaxID=1353009 RepID=A0A1Y2I6W6_TRAC3|nr:hypothetical protein PYCCODRAFT_1211525 [Trametes coccinea BRFM310]